MALHRRPSHRIIVVISALLVTTYLLLSIDRAPSHELPRLNVRITGDHPIDHLVRDAQREQKLFQTGADRGLPTLREAAQAYRAKRGRHPPPGFDAWYGMAVKSKALIDEFMFDQIYEDLDPFWGEEPLRLRSFAAGWPHVLSIRNNTVYKRSNALVTHWLDIWKGMIEAIPYLPDVDLAVSLSDEPHVLVAFSNISKYVDEAARQIGAQNYVPIADIRDEMIRYPNITGFVPWEMSSKEEGLQGITGATYWQHIVRACRPDDPIFSEQDPSVGLYSPPKYSANYTAGTIQGFVSNFTTSKNVCHNPNLRTLHGHIIGPSHDFIFTQLKPLFNAAKMQGVSNDILLPNPVHTLTWGVYQVEKSHKPWSERRKMAVWRGSATGGSHTASTWWGFHRLRFLHLMNSTVVNYVENRLKHLTDASKEGLPGHETLDGDWNMRNIPFPSRSLFQLAAQTYGKLGQWTAQIVDGALVDYFCAPFYNFGGTTKCSYLESYYSIGERMTPEEIDGYKYLPDIDGQSSSGRYRSFLHSLSVPIKASLFVEWSDARLRPWLHFVPMSGEFQEWFGLLEYFLGYQATTADEVSVPDHDTVGQWIGQQGAQWSRKVLRTEDMELYIYRLLLEYARICADNRGYLGWVGDL